MAPDFDVLRRAYLTPLQNPLAGVLIFWPFMLLYGVGSQLLTFIASAAWITGFWPHMLGPALMLAAWPLFAAGAIRWHRWLVLDEPVARLSLADGKRLRRYFSRTAALLALPLTVILVQIGVLLFASFAAGASQNDIGHIGLYFSAGVLLGDILVAVFLARFVLGLPLIAIEAPGAFVGTGLRQIRMWPHSACRT
jgi:hypothetical protein